MNLWHLAYIVPLSFAFGFISAALFRASDYQDAATAALDESHAATRYANASPEYAAFIDKVNADIAAKVKPKATPEEIAAARQIIKRGNCKVCPDVRCWGNCPGPNPRCEGWRCHEDVESARAWLAARGLSVEAPL